MLGASYQNGVLPNGVPPAVRTAALPPSRSFAWLDLATRERSSPGGAARFSQRQVEEVKLVLRMLPIFLTTILYWTIYMQVDLCLGLDVAGLVQN